jgi:hypothetical protein
MISSKTEQVKGSFNNMPSQPSRFNSKNTLPQHDYLNGLISQVGVSRDKASSVNSNTGTELQGQIKNAV